MVNLHRSCDLWPLSLGVSKSGVSISASVYTDSVQCQLLFFSISVQIILAIFFRGAYKGAMKVKLSTFISLDAIAKRYNVKDVPWANAAGIRRPTISELRRMVRNPHTSFGRSCTIDKINSLFTGLYKLLREAVMRKELLRHINDETDQDVRFLLYSLLLKDATQEARDAVESTMQLAAKTIIKSPKE